MTLTQYVLQTCPIDIKKLVALPVLLTLATTLNVVLAEEPALTESTVVTIDEEIITVGTRVPSRTTLDSTVPVQFLSEEDVESVATATDLVDVVQRLVPSFNVSREPISDGASFMRPPFVRGLDSDKVLVLVNGKRRHKGALVRPGGSGTHGPDIAGIPACALKSIEVLQDGASALYGSDAIAGVINFNLREEVKTTSFVATAGEYTQGGGDVRFAGNVGVDFLKGFLTLSGEFSDSRGTSRGKRYDLAVGGGSGLTPQQSAEVAIDTDGDGILDRFGPDSLTEIRDSDGRLLSLVWGADGLPDDLTPKYKENLPIPEQVWGEPSREDFKLVANFSLPVEFDAFQGAHLYGFGTLRDSESSGSFFYRRPGVGQLNPIRLADGSIYNPRDRFPGGFTPRFTGNVSDASWVFGIRQDSNELLTWDVSTRYGRSAMAYELENTWNPSMGPSSPTHFRPGELVSTEMAVNGDFEWIWTDLYAHPIFVAFGLEYRNDSYEILAGDEASYSAGIFARLDPFNWDVTQQEVDADPNDDLVTSGCRLDGHAELIASDPSVFAHPGGNCIAGDPIYNVMSVGSNGFPGYSPRYSTDRSRGGFALYLDLATSPSPQLTTDFALRLEDAGAYGFVTTAKFAAKYDLSDLTAVRSSLSTGFRAPTIGQISTISVSTRINADGNPVAEGIFPTSHPVSEYFGSQPLDPERSRHFTAGLIIASTPGRGPQSLLGIAPISSSQWHITLDGYIVDLNDRLTLTSPFVVDDVALRDLRALGVAEANSIAQVIYFSNALATRSMGVELVGEYEFASSLGETRVSSALNWNKIEITDQDPQTRSDGTTFLLVNAEGLFDFEHTWPQYRGVFSLNHLLRNGMKVMVRANRFGSHKNASNSSLSTIQEFDAKWQWDMRFELPFTRNYSATVSVVNAFDAVPDTAQFEACCGRIVRSDSLVPWQGPYYSLTVRYRSN
ncbi:MAG: TonB-dependent receptor plug domain-containing protein [Gammaproteobacteria bacterium]|nr:TonB-dependent receptor plug domain-containing protein [Gammaproteobacteria bacterium]MYD79950.1 TonB-dependent receptor plug domain-containing protein [Gammaproteobacteria bacterium]